MRSPFEALAKKGNGRMKNRIYIYILFAVYFLILTFLPIEFLNKSNINYEGIPGNILPVIVIILPWILFFIYTYLNHRKTHGEWKSTWKSFLIAASIIFLLIVVQNRRVFHHLKNKGEVKFATFKEIKKRLKSCYLIYHFTDDDSVVIYGQMQWPCDKKIFNEGDTFCQLKVSSEHSKIFVVTKYKKKYDDVLWKD